MLYDTLGKERDGDERGRISFMEHILRDNGGYIIITPAFPLPTLKLPVKYLRKELNPTFKHGFFVRVHHLSFSMALKRKMGYC